MAHEKLAIYGAIGANIAIAITKFTVAGITGSSAMLTMDLDFDTGTDTAEAAAAISNVDRQVRERYPMIRRCFIEAGSASVQQRWSRPDAVRPPADAPATSGLEPPMTGSL